MTKDTIHKMGNAIAIFSDSFEMAISEVLAEPIFRSPPRRSRSDGRWDRDALKVEFDVCGRHVLNKYSAALANGADPDESFMQCARGLAAVVGTDTNANLGYDSNSRSGKSSM